MTSAPSVALAGVGAAGASASSLPRAVGEVSVAFARRGDKTVLRDLYQRGSGKARFPKSFDGGPPEAVLINMAGGLTGGDCFQQTVDLDGGTHAVVTTQAAEKVYRASNGAKPARVSNTLTVKAAALEWLPQETLFFDRSRFERRLDIDMSDDARLLACEAMLFGRTAMGETVDQAYIRDDIRVRRGGRLIFADGIRFDGPVQSILDRPAVADGGRALATVLYVGPDSEDLVDKAKDVIDPFRTAGKRAAASRIGDLIVARFVAADSQALRAMLNTYLSTLRRVAAVPKLWRC